VRRRESGILPVTVEKTISSSKGEFLPHTISLSGDAATIYFDNDITTYIEHKLPLGMLWRHTVRAVADHQFQFQATAVLHAEKETPGPRKGLGDFGKRKSLAPTENRNPNRPARRLVTTLYTETLCSELNDALYEL
jgi:hypothetical protein